MALVRKHCVLLVVSQHEVLLIITHHEYAAHAAFVLGLVLGMPGRHSLGTQGCLRVQTTIT